MQSEDTGINLELDIIVALLRFFIIFLIPINVFILNASICTLLGMASNACFDTTVTDWKESLDPNYIKIL